MFSGAKGDIKVWNPRVESDDEYSTSRVSLESGPYYDFESIESGWAVSTNYEATQLSSSSLSFIEESLNPHIFCFIFLPLNFQVNPSVYGDRKTRLFVYWTVGLCQP